MLAAVDVQESMAMFKSDKKIDIFARQSRSRRFVPPGVPSPVSRFFPTTAPVLKFGRQRIWAATQKLFTFSSQWSGN